MEETLKTLGLKNDDNITLPTLQTINISYRNTVSPKGDIFDISLSIAKKKI